MVVEHGENAMQLFSKIEIEDSCPVGWSVLAMVASAEGEDCNTAKRICKIGGRVVHFFELYDALSALMDDRRAAHMLVVDCDSYGGLAVGRRAFAMLSEEVERFPVILVSSECSEQTFPFGRNAPIVLRNPLSAVALRVAMEKLFRGHALPVCG
jgi:hypothetical protein